MERPGGNRPGLDYIFTMDALGVRGVGVDDVAPHDPESSFPKSVLESKRLCCTGDEASLVSDDNVMPPVTDLLICGTGQVLLGSDFFQH